MNVLPSGSLPEIRSFMISKKNPLSTFFIRAKFNILYFSYDFRQSASGGFLLLLSLCMQYAEGRMKIIETAETASRSFMSPDGDASN